MRRRRKRPIIVQCARPDGTLCWTDETQDYTNAFAAVKPVGRSRSAHRMIVHRESGLRVCTVESDAVPFVLVALKQTECFVDWQQPQAKLQELGAAPASLTNWARLEGIRKLQDYRMKAVAGALCGCGHAWSRHSPYINAPCYEPGCACREQGPVIPNLPY